MLDIEQVPANVAVSLPIIVTVGVSPSLTKAAMLTPALSVMFSVYVPALTKMVCPEDAAVTAA